MTDISILAERLGKQYRIGAGGGSYKTLRETIVDAFAAPVRAVKRVTRVRTANAAAGTTFWALREVSFSIKRGEIVGIIGKNGAGKSTLLKILSRITEPTEGCAKLSGRVGSLLEVGAGFHPELTGLENIYLYGAILGMTRAEIKKKFDEIVAFAEVEKFIDTPVKHYSSGMYMRLAFAVSAHLETEILLVDEVLAVGDSSFQKKCMGKIGDVATSGRTVLFVSHNMAAVQHLCSNVLILRDGTLQYAGNVCEGIKLYASSSVKKNDVSLTHHPSRRPGSIPFLKAVRLTNRHGSLQDRFLAGEEMIIELEFEPVIVLDDPQFDIGIDDWLGTRIFSVATYLSKTAIPKLLVTSTVTCSIDELPLAPGRYSMSINVSRYYGPPLDSVEQVLWFDVEAGDFYGNGKYFDGLGRVLVRSRWDVRDGDYCCGEEIDRTVSSS